MDEGVSELDGIYIARVKRARQRPIAEKALDGGRLFSDVCERMRWGIRAQFPHYDEEQVKAELRRRLRLSRKLETLREDG